jgi:hypothetical protein
MEIQNTAPEGAPLAALSWVPIFVIWLLRHLAQSYNLYPLSTSSKDITIRCDPADYHEQQHTAPDGVFDYPRYTMAQVHYARATVCPRQTLVLANKFRFNLQPVSHLGHYRVSSRMNRFWIVRFYQRLTCDKRLRWILPSNFGALQ